MKNFKNVFKKVAIVMLIVALFASMAGNVYQYWRTNQMIRFANDMTDTIDSSWEEASAKMSISDKLLFENIIERNFEELLDKYDYETKTVITIE